MDIGKYDNRAKDIIWQLEGDYDPYNPIIINQWYRGKNYEKAVFYINSKGYIHLVKIGRVFELYDDGERVFNSYEINDYLLRPDCTVAYSKSWGQSKNLKELEDFIENKLMETKVAEEKYHNK